MAALRLHRAHIHAINEMKICETPRVFTENVISAAAFTRAAHAVLGPGLASCGITG